MYTVPKEAENPAVLDLRGNMAGSGPWYLSEWVPTAKTTFKRNPGFKQDKRDVPYMDQVDFVDLAEYSTILAQFKTGAIHDTFNNFLPDDILPTKADNPALEVSASSTYSAANDRAFFGYNPGSPFIDERVRQAWAMCWDRDLFIEVAFNTQKFVDAGLPVTTGYDNALRGQSYAGWYLDPKGKDFGPNAKYFKYDPAEAKKLLTAAGHPNGIEHDVFYGTLASHTQSYGQHIQILQGMARDTGLWRPQNKELEYNTEWNSQFRNNKGRFVGQAWIYDTGESDPANDLNSHYHSSGSRYFGPITPDATMDSTLERMLQEFDTAKRQALAHEVQRYEAGKMFQPRPGGATRFRITWPALRNREVWQGDSQGRYLATLWLDQTKPPFRA
jgi:ABC-type transport system substrate-binding protein